MNTEADQDAQAKKEALAIAEKEFEAEISRRAAIAKKGSGTAPPKSQTYGLFSIQGSIYQGNQAIGINSEKMEFEGSSAKFTASLVGNVPSPASFSRKAHFHGLILGIDDANGILFDTRANFSQGQKAIIYLYDGRSTYWGELRGILVGPTIDVGEDFVGSGISQLTW